MVNTETGIKISDALTGYRKGKRDHKLVRIEDLEFKAGELVTIAGANGAGKSTLIRSICGLLPLLEGHIFINKKDVALMSPAELATQIAVVLTHKVGGFNLKVKDAVAAGQMPYTNAFHRLENVHNEAVKQAMILCNIKDVADTLLDELSDGMFQKTMIARALAQQTRILLLDEPSAFLDYSSKHQLFVLLKELAHNQGKCVLISSHELDLALKYSDRMLLMGAGTVQLLDPDAAREDQLFKEMSGGFL